MSLLQVFLYYAVEWSRDGVESCPLLFSNFSRSLELSTHSVKLFSTTFLRISGLQSRIVIRDYGGSSWPNSVTFFAPKPWPQDTSMPLVIGLSNCGTWAPLALPYLHLKHKSQGN